VLSGAPWLELDGVHLARGGRPVLRGLSGALAGQAVGLVGANGAGKTTLIAALLGVLTAERGRISVLGLDIPRQAMLLRARAGVMAEQAGIFPGGSGVDAVAFAGALSGLDRREALRRAHRALDALGVGEERYRPTAGYSTGMRQKCKLGMCLLHEPDVLILDEPTLGLDPATRAELLELIRELRDRGTKMLLSTHILQDAEIVCDELLLLEGGVVRYAGPTAGLMGEEQHLAVARGAGIGPELAALLAQDGVEVVESKPGEVRFSTSDEALRSFWRRVAEAGAEVRHLGGDVRSLEDAVVSMMRAPMPPDAPGPQGAAAPEGGEHASS
jgi:ABC-2 type transport system ATP-binding protein